MRLNKTAPLILGLILLHATITTATSIPTVPAQDPIGQVQSVQENEIVLPNTTEVPTDILKDDSTKPPYALPYDQYGLKTINPDPGKLFRKIEAKLTQGVDLTAMGASYTAIIMGTISLVLVLMGVVFNKRLIGVGAIGFIICIGIYAIVGEVPAIGEGFKVWLLN